MPRIAAFVCVFFLAGCEFLETVFRGIGTGQLVTRTEEMQLLELGAHEFATSARSGTCPDLSTRGLGSPEAAHWRRRGGAAANGMLVAYANDFFPGADPFPCNEWLFSAVQGKALFDLSSIPRGALIDRAVLDFGSVLPVLTPSRGFLETTRDCGRFSDGSVFAEVGRASTIVPGTDTIGGLIGLRRPATDLRDTKDVRNAIRTMVASGSNLVQFVVSPKAVRHTTEHDVATLGPTTYCAFHIGEVSLEVTFRVPSRP